MAYCKSLINDQWSLIMQFSNMSFISMYSHVYSGIHVALLLKSVFLFICIFNFICSDLSSISSYSRLYSGMVALRKFASHANSKHLQQIQYWEDPRNWNIWCILTQKFQVNFPCVWSTFWCTLMIAILIFIIVVIIIIIIFICVWSTFWWGRRSRCPPRSGFPEMRRCKPGWLEPGEEKRIWIIDYSNCPRHTKKIKDQSLAINLNVSKIGFLKVSWS